MTDSQDTGDGEEVEGENDDERPSYTRQKRFYLRAEGAMPPNIGFAPLPKKLNDTKHCLTNSKHWRIGAKSSILWPSKYAKIRSRPALCPDPGGKLTAP